MYILNQAGTEIINSEYMERFCVARKPENALVVASPGRDKQPTTLGRYENVTEACEVLDALFDALRYSEDSFLMPPSCAHADDYRIRDARQKRRGGS